MGVDSLKAVLNRLKSGFVQVRRAFTPEYLIKSFVSSVAFVAAVVIAGKITGAEATVEQFLQTNGLLLFRTYLVYLLLYPFVDLIGWIIAAFLTGLFNCETKSPKHLP
jgi:cell division protein FtsX